METRLVIRVESEGAAKSKKELEALEAQGAKTERATDRLTKTTKQHSETAAEQAARIHKVVEASLARQAAQQKALTAEQAMTAATAEATTATEAAAAATRRWTPDVLGQGAALSALDDIMAGTAKTTEEIAAQEAALDQLMAAGTITAEEQAAALAALTAREEKLGLARVATTAATEAETEAAIGLKAASGGAIREYTALLDEVISGRTSRTPGTLAVLGGRLGLTQKLFSKTGLAIGGTVAAIGAFIGIMAKAEAEDAAFNQAVERTGGYIGVTRGQFRDMATDIAAGNDTIGEAKEALLEVANTGRYTGQQIEQIGKAALAMAHVTGMSVKDAVAEFTKLGDKPVDAAVKLNNQYHFLTAAVFDQIQALAQEGQTRQASELAQQAAAQAFEQRSENMEQNLGAIQKAWHGVEHAASDAWNAILSVGRKDTLEEKLADAKKKLEQLQAPQISVGKFGHVTTSPGAGPNDPAVIAQKTRIALLQEEVDKKKDDAEATARVAQEESKYVTASAALNSIRQHLDKNYALKQQLDALKEYHHDVMAIANDEKAKAEDRKAAQKLLNTTDWSALRESLKQEYAIKQAAHGNDLASVEAFLQTDEEKLQASYDAKRAIIERATKGNHALRVKLEAELDAKFAQIRKNRVQAQKDELAQERQNLIQSLQTPGERANAHYNATLANIDKLFPGKQNAGLKDKAFQQYGDTVTSGLENGGGAQSFDAKEAAINAEADREQAVVLANKKALGDKVTQLELRIEKDRQQKLAALEAQKNQMMLGASTELFDGLAGIAKAFGGKQSGAYKALFAVSKGFSIAQAIIAIQTGVAKALGSGIPPMNYIEAAAVAAKGAATIASIRSTNYAGAFDAGGRIPGGKWGIAGEYGPEIIEGPAQVTSRADTARLFQRGGDTYAPEIKIDARGAGPDEVAKLHMIVRNLRKQLHADYDYRQQTGHFPAVA